MEKHHYTGIFGILIGVVIAVGLVFYFKNLGVKTLYIGENPNKSLNLTDSKESSNSNQGQGGSDTDQNLLASEVVLNTPLKDGLVYSPLKIRGLAKGYWFWEGTMTVTIFDSSNKLLASGLVTSQGDSMTEGYVPFEGELVFVSPSIGTGKLVLNAGNPSGLPENNKSFELPIRFE